MNMPRLLPYLGAVVAAFFFILFVNTFAHVPAIFVKAPIVPDTNLAAQTSTELSSEPDATTSPATAAAPATPQTQKAPALNASAIQPVQFPSLPPVPTSAELDAAASVLRNALVNILCYAPFGSGLHSISGSGVFISSKGIILTNAHIGQYFLFSDLGVSCTIRTGSPATDRYEADLMFISPAWVNTNPDVLTKASPIGTGEHDFALLAVTKSATRAALPASFPFISLAASPPFPGTPIIIASYGAQFLVSSQVESSLFPTIVFGSVKDVFTFALNTIDVLALGGSAAAQEGSSGGGVADASGELVGTITTSTVEGSTDTRSLDAITASYIRSDYASETGRPLDLLLAGSTTTAIADFAPQIPVLEAILTAHL